MYKTDRIKMKWTYRNNEKKRTEWENKKKYKNHEDVMMGLNWL